MNKKALIFFILTILSFFISLFLNIDKINIPHFGTLHQEIQADVIFKNENFKIFFENDEIKNYTKIDKNHYLYKSDKFNLIKKIKIQNPKNIQKMMIFVGRETFFVDNIQNEIKINNDKNIFDKISISLLSYFYNPQFYLCSYVFLFLFLCNFKFNFKKTKIALLTLLFISFLLRLAQLNDIPFWDDEIYIITHTNKWLETLIDPGNPPLYFILFKIYRTFVQNFDFFRFSSVILGVLFNFCFYIYLKRIFNKKTAFIGLILATINIILIYFSQEIRCYMLLMLLAILNSYFLFKFNNKTKFYYLVSSLALLYTHFYGVFYVFYNFIFGLSIFKNKNKIKNFILINISAFLIYLPLLIYKKTSLITSFNSWIKPPNLNACISFLDTLFGNVFSFILFLIILFIIYFCVSKKNRLFIRYNYFAILSVFLFAFIFSYLIKPIFLPKYFYIVFPNVLALIAFIYSFLSKKKITICLIFLLFFLFNFKLNNQNLYCNHNIFINFIRHDIDKTKTNFVFLSDTIKGYKDFEIKEAKMQYMPVNQGIDVLNIEKYNIPKNSIIYALNFYLDEKILNAAKKIDLYKTPLGVFCKIEL